VRWVWLGEEEAEQTKSGMADAYSDVVVASCEIVVEAEKLLTGLD